jgi:hypothetical protein
MLTTHSVGFAGTLNFIAYNFKAVYKKKNKERS